METERKDAFGDALGAGGRADGNKTVLKWERVAGWTPARQNSGEENAQGRELAAGYGLDACATSSARRYHRPQGLVRREQ